MLVQDNFDDNNLFGWTSYGGNFAATNGALVADEGSGAKALLDTNFGDLTLDIDVTLNSPQSDGDAGVVFRATNPSNSTDGFEGYYAGIKNDGNVVLWKMGSTTAQIGNAAFSVSGGTKYHLQVKASGSDIKVFVDDMNTAKISITDGDHTSGMDGVRVFHTAATFDNFDLQEGA